MQDDAARLPLLVAVRDPSAVQLTPGAQADLAEAETGADRGGFAADEGTRATFADTPASPRPPPRHAPHMDRDQILARLRDRAPDLCRRSVVRAALFGSVARGEARPDSDIDILIELDPEVVRTLFDYAGVKNAIGNLFDTEVDVVDRAGLKTGIRPGTPVDAIYAF